MIKQGMGLRVALGLSQIPVPLESLLISELSPLELEVALDKSLAEVNYLGLKPEAS